MILKFPAPRAQTLSLSFGGGVNVAERVEE